MLLKRYIDLRISTGISNESAFEIFEVESEIANNYLERNLNESRELRKLPAAIER